MNSQEKSTIYIPKTVILSIEELRERLKHWQKVLRLQDWIIIVDFAEGSVIHGDASNQHSASLKRARVLIASEETWKPSQYQPEHDMELDIVHELLHLHFSGMETPNEGPGCWSFEGGIECIATALIGLHREAEIGENE